MTDPHHEHGYWCVVCGRLVENEDGKFYHDDIPHPDLMDFHDEDNPQ